MFNQPQQVKHTLPTITIQDGRTGRTVTWRTSQPVQIWSVGATKWCPGEISYITQDADGYCLDVRYWAKPQLPKAKYLAPLSECLRPISSDFTCRTDWTSGSKVECFSNSQKRWYKATVVDVIRYPDDKEDWLKIQWSLDISSNYANTPTSTNSNTPQIMSKEVGRSSIWIRHRYPSFKNQSPPNMDNQTPKQISITTPNNQRRKARSKKKFKREKDIIGVPQIQSRTSNDSNRSKIKMDEMMDSIISSLPSRGPPSKEVSYSMPDPYQSNMIRKFDAQSQNNSFINEENDNQQKYGGPSISSKSKKVSSTSQHCGHLTPQFEAVSGKNKQEEAMFDYILDKMPKHNENNMNDDNKEGDALNQQKNASPELEFGAEFKPNDYKQKANVQEMDLEMEKAFMQSDSSESGQESEFDSEFNSNDGGGSVVVKPSEDEDEDDEDEEDSDTQSDGNIDSSDDDNKDKPLIPQSETRKAESTGNSWDEEKKELIEEIEELKFRLQIAEQDLNEERETSGPLLKEVEMQKIRIAKLDEQIAKLHKTSQRNSSDLSANDEMTEHNENNNEEMTAKLEEFKKSIATPKTKSKRHKRSQSLSDFHYNDDVLIGTNKKNRFEGLKAQELIDAIYDRKVTLLNDQILRLQSDLKKKDSKLLEYKAKDRNRKREIQLLESELSDIKHENNAKSRSDTQNISMYRDQVRKLTQTNDALKKALQTADDKLKSAELKKQDLSEEFKIQRQITNNLQQKVQRVLQQNNTIGSQVDALHQIQSEQNNMMRGAHSRHYSTSAAHNHLDTIRKCNMRAIQILHEIIEKNRRKRSDGYSLNKYSRESANMFGGSNNAKQRKSKTDGMDNGLYNASRGVVMNYSGDDMHDEEYDRYHSTKSTRFSDKKSRNDAKNTINPNNVNNNIRKSSYNSSRQITPITNNNNQRFDFGDNTVGVNEAQSTRSRSYNTHHQQRSEQMMHNMQPLVLKEQKQQKQKQGKLLSVDEQQQILSKNKNNGYNIRQKRVSYDYVDGNQSQNKYQQKKQKLFINQMSFDENEEDQYQENRFKPQIRHNQQSMATNNDNEEGDDEYDMQAYFEKLWTVKFPRRASKVQLFGSNKGHKTQILFDDKYLIFKCDQSNNNLVTKINAVEIKNYEITEKKNLSIFVKNGKKYKIKCEQEKEVHFWYNILTQFISTNAN